MTPEEFEGFLLRTKSELISKMNKGEGVNDLDVYFKTLMDYEEICLKEIFKKIQDIENDMSKMRGDLLKDSRERFEIIMEKLN